MKYLGLLIFTYAFLGTIFVVGCSLHSMLLHRPGGITVEEFAGQLWISSENPVDCEKLYDMIENRSPYICAPWKKGAEFNRQQDERKNRRLLYKENCRLL
jgi:hypothetical protein